MSTSIKGKDDTVVEMVENSLSNSPSNLDQKAEEHEFMEAENQMTLWQAAVAHKRILLYCKLTNRYRVLTKSDPYVRYTGLSADMRFRHCALPLWHDLWLRRYCEWSDPCDA